MGRVYTTSIPNSGGDQLSCFSRFGYSYELFTNQGKNFESGFFRKLCQTLWIHKTRTTPYRPSSNGKVERYNRTVMDAVRCYVNGRPKCWDQYLGPLAGALRSALNRHTGHTANKLMLGREVKIPATIMYPLQILMFFKLGRRMMLTNIFMNNKIVCRNPTKSPERY